VTLALIATVLSSLSGPAAVFWSGGRTWVVDADAGELYFAAGWYASEGERVHRYRMRADASRAGASAHPVRWTVLEHNVVGSRTWRAITSDSAGDGLHQDERVVLQFTGSRATVGRFTRGPNGRTASATTWRLPDGRPLAPPRDADAAVEHLVARLPGIAPRPARGVVERELAGGRWSRWLVLADDRGGVRALALDRPPPFEPAIDLPELADLRPSPDGTLALALQGPRLGDEGWRHDDLLGLHDPCDARRLLLWRAGRPPAELGRVARLDGARWLDSDDPLRSLVPTRFLAARTGDCFAALAVGGAGTPTAHRCRTDEVDRAWGGPSDLAAAAGLRLDEAAEVRVVVRDPERERGDAVRLYFGGGRPASVTVSPDGLRPHGRRRKRRALAEAVRADWRPVDGGYAVSATIPRDLLGDPPALTVLVTDTDADGTVRLWVAGERVAGHQPRATAVIQ